MNTFMCWRLSIEVKGCARSLLLTIMNFWSWKEITDPTCNHHLKLPRERRSIRLTSQGRPMSQAWIVFPQVHWWVSFRLERRCSSICSTPSLTSCRPLPKRSKARMGTRPGRWQTPTLRRQRQRFDSESGHSTLFVRN
jgi:hypothetical protein